MGNMRIMMLRMRMIVKNVKENWECPNCKAIHSSPKEDSWLCWNCCKKIPTDTPKMRYY